MGPQGSAAGAGQRVGLERQTEDMEASCGDPCLQKCCPPMEEGAAVSSLWPLMPHKEGVSLCVLGGEGVVGGEGTRRVSQLASTPLPTTALIFLAAE